MAEHINVQAVMASLLGGIVFVCMAFLIYWKLLGEKYILRKRLPAHDSVTKKNQSVYRQSGERYVGAEI